MIEIKNLYKSFDDIKAVDDVSFDIKEKTVFGLIGTNGAGKSTTLRMIAGVYKADAGNVLIDVKAAYDGEYVKKLSFMFDVKCFLGTFFKVIRHEGVVEGGPKAEKDED